MIRDTSEKQLSLSEFDWPFQTQLDAENRWVKLAGVIPWDELGETYYKKLDTTQGRPSKPARLVIGAVIIKHKLVLSDRETIDQLSENPYLQYFAGLPGFQCEKPFDASLLVTIRHRMGQDVFDEFHQTIVNQMESLSAGKPAEQSKTDDPPEDDGSGSSMGSEQIACVDEASEETASHQGRLILDATVAEQAIRYPTDLSLLNEAREFTEQIIDHLYGACSLDKKPRTYRVKARREYLSVAKKRKNSKRKIRKAIKGQLQYVGRNLRHIEQLLSYFEVGVQLPLPNGLLRRYWVIPHVYTQQLEMYQSKAKRCDDRIVSISQPWVRPIVRGKQHKSTEFGAKINVSLDAHKLARVDRFSWDAYHEGNDLEKQVEAYQQRYGHYPEVLIGDGIYGTRANRAYLKSKQIRFGGKPVGRPRKQTPENEQEIKAERKQRQSEYRQRIPIEGKFGQGKGGYRLNYIRAKRSATSQSWVNSIFLVMNLLVLYELFYWLRKRVIRSRMGCRWVMIAWSALISAMGVDKRGVSAGVLPEFGCQY